MAGQIAANCSITVEQVGRLKARSAGADEIGRALLPLLPKMILLGLQPRLDAAFVPQSSARLMASVHSRQ
jgi:hypothetical protein